VHSEEAQQLYEALMKECARVFDEARSEQPITLQALPALANALVAQVRGGNERLSRLSSAVAGGFALPRHAVNVAVLACRVGSVLGLSELQLQEVALAALLHDIGIIGMEHLVHLPAHLTPEQRTRVREHPLLAHRLLQRTQAISPLVCELILQQHEREDGSGYPRQLAGAEIQEPAQLLGLAQVFEALTHDRPYRGHLPPAEALRTLVQDQRAGFRDRLLKGLLQTIPVYPVESWVRLSTGELAQVVAEMPHHPLSPTVAVRFDPQGQPLGPVRTVALARDRSLSILRAVPAPAA
jgi:HD-GYP domain-containing protein (c-di-GMP phosphodiesterase class II)